MSCRPHHGITRVTPCKVKRGHEMGEDDRMKIAVLVGVGGPARGPTRRTDADSALADLNRPSCQHRRRHHVSDCACPDGRHVLHRAAAATMSRVGPRGRDVTVQAELAAYDANRKWFGLGDKDFGTHIARSCAARQADTVSGSSATAARWGLRIGGHTAVADDGCARRRTWSSNGRRAGGDPLPGMVVGRWAMTPPQRFVAAV